METSEEKRIVQKQIKELNKNVATARAIIPCKDWNHVTDTCNTLPSDPWPLEAPCQHVEICTYGIPNFAGGRTEFIELYNEIIEWVKLARQCTTAPERNIHINSDADQVYFVIFTWGHSGNDSDKIKYAEASETTLAHTVTSIWYQLSKKYPEIIQTYCALCHEKQEVDFARCESGLPCKFCDYNEGAAYESKWCKNGIIKTSCPICTSEHDLSTQEDK